MVAPVELLAARAAANMVVASLPSELRTLSANSHKLKLVPRKLGQVSDKNAPRRLFIIGLAEFLFEIVGVPCRTPTLEISRLFFECEDLVVADISSIAPLGKNTLRR